MSPGPYRQLFDHVLTRTDPERIHAAASATIRGLPRVPGAAAAVRRSLRVDDPGLRVSALGLSFPGPFGLAAGFDKDATGVAGLAALGFGFVEVGTVTALPQPGNPRPRLARLPADRAVVNRMGFNNAGAKAAAARLAALPAGLPPVGVNIGKSRAVDVSDAVGDFASSARLVAPHADYLVVNVSSPNTPGLRDLQAVAALRPILTAVQAAADTAAARHVPLLVKVAPDLADADLVAVADLAVELGLDGIVATNTTLSRAGLRSSPAEVAAAGDGGLSGAPLAGRSLAVLRLLRAHVGDRLVLVSVGGVGSAEGAWQRIRAGATLVQAYAAFVYEGPLWPARVQRGLLARAWRAGFPAVQDAVGVATR
jgi:dihydroorotate dehydrogenase